MKEAIRKELENRVLSRVRYDWNISIICILCNDYCWIYHYRLWVNEDVIIVCEDCTANKSDEDLINEIFIGYFRHLMELN